MLVPHTLNKMDSNAGLQLDPKTWGPHVWASLHTAALKADSQPDGFEAFQHFVYALTQLLPCDKCRTDYTHYVLSSPPKASHTFAWTVELHNWVNEKLGHGLTMSLEDAREHWTGGSKCSYSCAGPAKAPTAVPLVALVGAIVAVLLLIAYLTWPSQTD